MCKSYVLTENLSFEIAANDLQEMTWNEARAYTLIVGERWRLPTMEELDEMYRLHAKAVGGFQFKNYWSSKGYNDLRSFAKSFSTGIYSEGVTNNTPAPKCLVRLVRNF
ncbi:hypothetical protein ACFSX9_11855 [Flavobacterium ardleyense]|uniref:DUF1566 domain-containing protein n=1 Tax=Flavobacterium ardleyense TaxID=2038737 RepID=A0ABW5ZBD5_9FLAO